MLHTICGSGMTLRLIRPICPFNCFLFRVDSLYHLRLNGGILQIIRSLTDHINGFDFISTLAFFSIFFLDYQPMTERHVCLAAIVIEGGKEKKKTCLKLLEILRHGCAELVLRANNTFFFGRENKIGNNSLVIKRGLHSSSIYMYSVMKIQLVISHSLSFIWSKRAHDKWSMRNLSKLALCENMSHPCLSSTEWTSFAPQAPSLPYSHSPLHKATRTRQFA